MNENRDMAYHCPLREARLSTCSHLRPISMLTQGPNEDTGLALEGEGVSCTPLRTTPLYMAFHRRWYGGRSNRYLVPEA